MIRAQVNQLELVNIAALVLVWLLGFYGFHAQIYFEGENWVIPTLAIATQIAIAVIATGVAYRARPNSTKTRSILLTWLPVTVVALIACVHLRDLTLSIYWTSEYFIANDALTIISGSFINPLRNSGDFPTSFMSYVAVPFVWLTGDVQVGIRLLGVAALGAFALCLAYQAELITGTRRTIAAVFPLLSLWLINISNTADNNWLCVIHLQTALVFLIYSLAVFRDRLQLVPLLALLISLCIWTLYIPLIFGGAVAALFVVERRVPWRQRALLILWLLPFLLPLTGAVIKNYNAYLGRHAHYISQTGEAALEGTTGRFERYWLTVESLGERVIPDEGQAHNPDRSLYLELPLLALIVVGLSGFFMRTWDRAILHRVLVVFMISLVGLIASNPVASFWRTTVFIQPIFLFVALGASFLMTLTKKKRVLGLFTAVVLVVFQWFSFQTGYAVYKKRLVQDLWQGPEQVTTRLFETCATALHRHPSIVIPDHLQAEFLQSQLLNRVRVVRMRDEAAFLTNSPTTARVIPGQCTEGFTEDCGVVDDNGTKLLALCKPKTSS